VEESLARQGRNRESRWTESIAVGSKAVVEKTKAELGIKAIGREVMGADPRALFLPRIFSSLVLKRINGYMKKRKCNY